MKPLLKKFVQWYLKMLTIAVVRRHKPEIIAVAGSVNKTQTKDTIKKALSPFFSIRANPKSYNTEIGLPLAVLYLPSGESDAVQWLMVLLKGTAVALWGRDFPKKLVLELGIDRPGDMAYLMTLIRPDIAVITNITDLYITNFGNFEKMLREYEILVRRVPKNGLVIIDKDDPQAEHLARLAQCDVKRIALSDARYESAGDSMRFTVKHGNKALSGRIKGRGEYRIKAFLYALILAEYYSLDVGKLVSHFQE